MPEKINQQKMTFTILSGDSTDGDGGFGIGSISLDNLTPIIIDPEENNIYIDMGALHAKSQIEKMVRFKPEKEHAESNPKQYWIVWLALQNSGSGPYYSGAAASEVLVSREERRIKLGYKSLPEHVNHMDKSLKNQFILAHMDGQSLGLLREYLTEYDAGYWERSSEELKRQLHWRSEEMQTNLVKTNSFKEAMANYPTGVTVVTAIDGEGNPMGLTVNSFASLSLDPLLILWSIDKRVSTYEAFKKADKFAVNILADDQADIASLFASRNRDRFANCDWSLSKYNLPIIKGTIATLQCKTFKQVEAGDHTVLIGEISEISVEKKSPLVYHGRKMGALPASFHED